MEDALKLRMSEMKKLKAELKALKKALKKSAAAQRQQQERLDELLMQRVEALEAQFNK